MALIRSTPPPAMRQAWIAGLAPCLRPGDPLAAILLDEALQGPRYWLRILTLGLQDIALATPTEYAKLAGWRILAGGPFPPIAADVTERLEGVAPRLTSILRGPQIETAFQAARDIELRPEIATQDFELQMLSIPGLLIEAHWLKSQSGGVDLVIPFHTLSKELEPTRAYPMSDFLDAVRPLVPGFLELGQ